jgi:GGDEF domain-containing protein
MTVKKLPKEICNKIGRSFALVFNRSMMYNIEHPFTAQALSEFYDATTHGLTLFSPVVLIMHQDNFFIEEEPLDPRINTDKMLNHFKKANIQSISFESGLHETEVINFAAVFIDIAQYVNADAMKSACEKIGVSNIKINHVFYQKITADDEVVDRRVLDQSGAGSTTGPVQKADQVLGMMVESALMEELEKSLSVQSIIENPGETSQKIIAADQAAVSSGEADAPESGMVIMAQLQKIRDEVNRSFEDAEKPSLGDLADAVFAMKKELINGLSARKAEGVSFENEQQILEETESLTDTVLVQLIREEYQEGKISVQRLAQILRRLVPEPGELQRLMPKIKTALLEEGMNLQEFLQLTRELKQELQSEDLVKALERSADQMGIDPDILIEEVSRDPKSAAELIYLASEIRKGSEDEEALSDLLVDYIERVGSEIAIDAAQKEGEAGSRHLQSLISNIEKTLVDRLKNKDISTDVLQKVASRLNERMEECLEALKAQWTIRHKAFTEDGQESATSVLGVFKEGAASDEELEAIMDKVRSSIDDQGNANQPLKDGDQESKSPASGQKDQEKQPTAGLPKGILVRNSILYILEKEVARSIRYDTPFSVLMLSVFKVTPSKPLPAGAINRGKIMQFILTNLIRICRTTDIIGVLDQNKFLILLPMTPEKESRAAMRRILKQVHDAEYLVDGTEIIIKLAGVVTTFDKDRTPTLTDLVKRAESDIFDMVNRLRNIQSIY